MAISCKLYFGWRCLTDMAACFALAVFMLLAMAPQTAHAQCVAAGGNVFTLGTGVSVDLDFHCGGVGAVNGAIANVTANIANGDIRDLTAAIDNWTVNIAAGVSATSFTGSNIISNDPGFILNNSGTLTTNVLANGVNTSAGATVNNFAGGIISAPAGRAISFAFGTLTNSGVISSGVLEGVFFSSGGMVTNNAGGTITGGTDGVEFIGAAVGTVINEDTITGTGGTAVNFGTGNDILELRPGFVFNGNVLGDGGTDTLRFGGTGAATFDVSNIDTGGNTQQFRSFETLVKTGTSIWTLTGNTTFNGGITVEEGTLSLATNTAAGTGTITTTGSVIDYANAVNIANLVNINSNTTQMQVLAGSAEQSGVISETAGPRPLEKIGAGTLNLTGTNTFTGPLTISAGTLVNNGSLLSPIVTNGGSYTGTGTSGSLTAGNGATVAPGNSIGTLNVAGNVVFNPGSTFQVEIDNTPASDLISATGTATLNGGTVQVITLSPDASFVDGTVFTILTAAGGVTGTFGGVTETSAFLDFLLSYNANNVLLTLRKVADFTSTAITPNQIASSTGLAGLGTVGPGDAATVFNAVSLLSGAQSRAAFDAASGEVHASLQQGVLDAADMFAGTLQRRAGLVGGNGGGVAVQILSFAPDAPQTAIPAHALALGEEGGANNGDTVVSSWAGLLGERGDYDSDGNAAAFDQDTYGFAGGLDVASVWNNMQVTGGIAAGYTEGNADVTARASSADISSWYIGIYGALEDGPLRVSGSMSYAGHDIDTTRSIIFPGINRIATASYDADTFAASAEAAWRFALNNNPQSNWTLAPLVKLDVRTGSHDGVTETGAGALNLVIASQSFDRVDGGIGFALGYRGMVGNWNLTTETRAVWLHAFDDGNPTQSLAFAGAVATPFTVSGTNRGSDRMELGFGLNAELSNRVSLNTRYDGSFFGNATNHQGHIALNVGLN